MVNKSNAPDGYSSVTPYFTVNGADEFMAFLTAAFEATVVVINRHENGRVQHARMRIGTSIVMLNDSSENYPEIRSQMHLFVKDADATYHASMLAGAESLMEPNDRPHGDRMAGVKDPNGNVWWIATHRT